MGDGRREIGDMRREMESLEMGDGRWEMGDGRREGHACASESLGPEAESPVRTYLLISRVSPHTSSIPVSPLSCEGRGEQITTLNGGLVTRPLISF